jgi:hypothetical protein
VSRPPARSALLGAQPLKLLAEELADLGQFRFRQPHFPVHH